MTRALRTNSSANGNHKRDSVRFQGQFDLISSPFGDVCGRTHPFAPCGSIRRAIQRLDSANSVTSCARTLVAHLGKAELAFDDSERVVVVKCDGLI